MKPKNLDNVVAMVALFRPGPMEFIPTYIRRMHDEEEVSYRHEALAPIFEETYGIPVYQEQIMQAAVDLAGYTASEADGLRKAIAKKIREKLVQHRQKFVQGAQTNGIPPEVADTIFSDWEEFARYGFNKSHAVDYGVIAVQTAFLKAHYAVEYMTALLSVAKNDTDKVAFYVADCRRMGIEVLPPDVNASDWDFTIEDLPEGGSAIRFGLGAIKNVGQGAVEVILEANRRGHFEDISDFARRVDLRQVGRRALECLTKVGALSRFGTRTTLLEALDQIHAISASHFRAKETGQLSMFGPQTGLVARIQLPAPTYEISRREQLSWEKELIGLYVSDHPLKPHFKELERAVTHFSTQLSECADRERVRVAGLVASVRPHVTKAGKAMAFVQLEDLQGVIELVVFPKTWESFGGLLEYDKVVLISGQVDARGTDPKVLVDSVTTEFELIEPAPSANNGSSGARAQRDIRENARAAQPASRGPTGIPAQKSATSRAAALDDEDVPPPPEAFPDDWANQPAEPPVSQPVKAGGTGEEPVHAGDVDEVPEPAAAAEPASRPKSENNADLSTGTEGRAVRAASTGEAAAQVSDDTSPPLPMQTAPERPKSEPDDEGRPGDPRRMITIVLRSSGDKTRDILHLRRIHGTLISYPGTDRFAFFMVEAGRSYVLEFPNFTTKVCDPLLGRLRDLVGEEHVKVDVLTLQ
jgi:DNA polymerase-3 subunit alpha